LGIIVCVIIYPAFYLAILIAEVCVTELGTEKVNELLFNLVPGSHLMKELESLDNDNFGHYGPYLMWIFSLLLPFVLTTIIATVCAGIQIHAILKPSTIAPTTQRDRQMTITIVMLTVVCLVCNLPYTFFIFFWTDTQNGNIAMYILSTILPFLNAGLNPAILLVRGAALRQFVRASVESVCGLRARVQNGENVVTRNSTVLEDTV